jgi:hypothetical protein
MAETKKKSTTSKAAVKKVATKNKPAAKKVVSKVKTTTKKVVAKKTTAKKTVVKKTTVKKNATKKSTASVQPSAAERYRMVQTAAYFIAERRGFVGCSSHHWAEAEREVSAMLSKK